MNLNAAVDLFPGEAVLLSKPSSAIITVDEHGLSRFALDHLMWTVGMQGKETIGGKLHLTNFRFVFKSHAANRLTGKFSLFLPTIREVRETSRGITRKIAVATQTQHFEFVVWGIPRLLAAFREAQAGLDPAQVEALQGLAAADPGKCGTGLQVFEAVEAVNRRFVEAGGLAKIIAHSKGPVEASGVLNLLEFLAEDAREPDGRR